MKDEYSLLNDVEVDFSQYTIEEVNEFEKKRMMKKFLNSKDKKRFCDKKKVLAAIVALLLAVNLGVHGDKVIAMATSFKSNIGTWLGFEYSKEKYSADIGKTLEGNAVKITLNEFFIGNSRIIVNFNINKGQNEAVKTRLKLIPDVYIDGKKIERNSDSVGYGIGKVDEEHKESNVTLEVDGKDLVLNNKNEVKLVFSNLAKECSVSEEKFTYSFIYDSTRYKNASKTIKVDKSIIIGENNLSIGEIIVAPDRVYIAGSSKGFSVWENSKDVDYHYDVVDENNNLLSMKEEIGNGAYFYRVDDNKNITNIKIVPYTYNKISTNIKTVSSSGRTKYILEDKIITIDLK